MAWKPRAQRVSGVSLATKIHKGHKIGAVVLSRGCFVTLSFCGFCAFLWLAFVASYDATNSFNAIDSNSGVSTMLSAEESKAT